jgi:DeoR family suf operon transcriptional repressor
MTTTLYPAAAALPDARHQILKHIKTQGEAGAESIAAALGITVSGARQHLTAIERDGLITHRDQRDGPGRPRHLYALTAAGDALFPRAYAELTNELLEYVDDEDPQLLARIFARRARRRLEQARARTQGHPFAEKVAIIARILDEDGYLADFAERDDGTFVISEHNCAVLSVAQRYSLACSSELEFLSQALPEAEVERIAHRIGGAHVCAYHVRPRR